MKFSLSYLIGQVPDEAWERLYSPGSRERADASMSAKDFFINEVLGDDPIVSGARSPLLAVDGDMALCGSKEYIDDIADSPCQVVVASDTLDDLGPSGMMLGGKVVVRSPLPRLLMTYLLQPFLERRDEYDVSEAQTWGEIMKIRRVECADDSFRGSARNATIGKNCIIHPFVVIGCDGFGFEIDHVTGAVLKIPHFGRVIIGDNVEIFPFANIARGSLDDTVIGDNVKIDALCHIAHNVRIGAGSLVIANSMIAGSVRIGERAWIAPSTSINNGAHMGDDSMTGTGSVVTKPVDDKSLVLGVPARHQRYREVA